MSLLYQLSTPVIFAHRGVSAHAPENTLAAFQLAIEHKADGIELDAMLSADQKVVVIHDHNVNRTTGAHGLVNHLPLSTLRELDAGHLFSAQFIGERIPTLEEVFQSVGKNIVINIELKNYHSPKDSLPDEVADLVRMHDMEGHVLFSSFLPSNLKRIHKLLPEVPIALLAMPGAKGQIARSAKSREISPRVLHPHYTNISQKLMKREKAAGRRIHAWTVNEVKEMRRLFDLQVNGIITDDPRLARQTLENQ